MAVTNPFIETRAWRHAYVRRLIAWGVKPRMAIESFWMNYMFDDDFHRKSSPIVAADCDVVGLVELPRRRGSRLLVH